MSAVLRAPLVVAAGLAVAVALLTLWQPFSGALLGAGAGVIAALLAAASADAPRRLLWSATAVGAAGMAARAFVVPPAPDLWPLVAAVTSLRGALALPLAALVPEPESGILLGIVLGERASMERDLREAFAVTGTTHLLAISGFNMTLVAAGVALALRRWAPPVAVAAATVAAVCAYSALVGPQPSVVRAALMASVGAIALALGRPGAAPNALGAAVLAMLLGDPAALEDVGFLLSVAATGGLIVWQRGLAERFAGLPSPLAEGLAATLAASLPTIPIVAAVFGRVSLVSPLANLVAVPLFAPILLFGAATAAVGAALPDAAAPLAMAAYASAAALRHAVEAFAAVPLASAEVPSGPATALVLAGALALAAFSGPPAVAAVMGTLRPLARTAADLVAGRLGSGLPASLDVPGPQHLAMGALAVAAVAAGALATSGAGRSDGLRVRALDVGQGDAFLIESAGRYTLIDGGPDPARLLRELGEALPPWERRIDLVVLTHEHADHGNGLLAVLDRYDVRVAVEPAGMADVPFVRAWAERLTRAGTRRVAVEAGATLRSGSVTFRVLAPGRDRSPSLANLVLLGETSEGRILFMGDATDDAVADLLLAPTALEARLYVPPHHGARTPHAAALLEAVRPEAALISVGAANRYGHPTPETLAALAGVPVYRTDRHGTVEVELDGDRIHVRTDKAGVPPDRGGSVPGAPPAR